MKVLETAPQAFAIAHPTLPVTFAKLACVPTTAQETVHATMVHAHAILLGLARIVHAEISAPVLMEELGIAQQAFATVLLDSLETSVNLSLA